VINRSPKGPRARAELTSAFGELLGLDGAAVPTPLHLPDRRHLDQTHRDVVRFNDGWIAPLVGTVQALLDREPEAELSPPMPALEPVRPGSLGSWADDEAADG